MAALQLVPNEDDNRAIRRLPRRIEEVELGGVYEGFHVTAWINYSGKVQQALESRDAGRIREGLMKVILEHDLVDDEGEAYSPASDPKFWDEIPGDLAATIVQSVQGCWGKLPKASAATSSSTTGRAAS